MGLLGGFDELLCVQTLEGGEGETHPFAQQRGPDAQLWSSRLGGGGRAHDIRTQQPNRFCFSESLDTRRDFQTPALRSPRAGLPDTAAKPAWWLLGHLSWDSPNLRGAACAPYTPGLQDLIYKKMKACFLSVTFY